MTSQSQEVFVWSERDHAIWQRGMSGDRENKAHVTRGPAVAACHMDWGEPSYCTRSAVDAGSGGKSGVYNMTPLGIQNIKITEIKRKEKKLGLEVANIFRLVIKILCQYSMLFLYFEYQLFDNIPSYS